jgi:hypothetical protein
LLDEAVGGSRGYELYDLLISRKTGGGTVRGGQDRLSGGIVGDGSLFSTTVAHSAGFGDGDWARAGRALANLSWGHPEEDRTGCRQGAQVMVGSDRLGTEAEPGMATSA